MLAKCAKCGVELIVPHDGQPYWCTECSIEEELKDNLKFGEMEEREEFTEACRVANKDLWVNDDGSV